MTSAESFVLNSQNDVPEFLQKSNYRELLFLCSKAQLIILAEFFELGVSTSDKKGEILLKVIQGTQEVMRESKIMHEKLEFERLQLEKLKLEREENEKMREREREREEREREREEIEREREERKG